MALHTGTMGGLGQVNGPLLEANTNVGGPDQSHTPPIVSAQSQQPPPSGFMKYAAPFGGPPQGHTTPGGDPYANGGGGMMTAAYGEESGQPQPQQLQPPPNISPNSTQQQQPPTAAAPNTMQQQQQFVQSNQQQQRMAHPPPPTIIDPNPYIQQWNNAPGSANSNAMAAQQQQQIQQQQPPPNFDEAAAAALMTNGNGGGGVVVASSGAQLNSTPALPPTYNSPMVVGDRRLITTPLMGGGSTLQPQLPQQPGSMQYVSPRFSAHVYHHNPNMQPPSQTPTPGYMPMPHHDPSSMNPTFVPNAGPPPTMMNGGQRMYAPGLPPISGQRTAIRGPAPGMNFGYYTFPDGSQQPMAPMCPPPGGFQQMPPIATTPGLQLQPSGELQPQQPQPGPSTGRRNNATDATGGGGGAVAKKRKAKTTKARSTPARGNSRGGANAPNKVVGNPSVTMGGGSMPPMGGIGGPPMGSSQPPPPQIMGGPGLVGGIPPHSGPPLPWSTSFPRSPNHPNPNILTNGSSMDPMNPLQPPPISTQQQQHIMATQQMPAGTPHYGPTPHLRGRVMGQQHQQQQSAPSQPLGMIQQPQPHQTPQQQQQQQIFSDPSSEKLGYPIPNGLLVRSTMLQIDKEQARQSPNSPQVRVLEFDISQGHLDTIIGRSDLDIAISCHLAADPPQVCHWADDVREIRFNDRVLSLDRRVLNGGSVAHKVATLKDFCNVTQNKLEVILSPTIRSSRTELSLSDFLFTVFMVHMPSIKLVLEGSMRNTLPYQPTFLDRLVEYCKPQNPQAQVFAAELPLVCPIYKTRIKIPARFSDCKHLEVFDFEAFLQQEALWPRLRCPICNVLATGIDGFVVDTILQLLFARVPERFNAIRVRSDSAWHPVISDALRSETEEWTPIWGPYTKSFAYYLEHGIPPPNHLPPILTNGILESSKHPPLTNEQLQQQRAHDNHQSDPSKLKFQSMTQLSNSSSYATAQPVKTEPAPYQKEKFLCKNQTPTNSLPDLSTGVEGAHTNPNSLPSTPTFPNNSPTGLKLASKDLKRSRGSSFGEKETQNSHENLPKLSRLAIAQRSRQLDEDPETLAALQELPDLSLLSRPDVAGVIYSLTKSIK